MSEFARRFLRSAIALSGHRAFPDKAVRLSRVSIACRPMSVIPYRRTSIVFAARFHPLGRRRGAAFATLRRELRACIFDDRSALVL